jgi:hypothetical protein
MAIVNGTNGGDTLYGTGASDQINGLNGNDSLKGFGGADRLDGGAASTRCSTATPLSESASTWRPGAASAARRKATR